MSTANANALAKIAAVRPQWTAVRSAAEALGLTGKVLLHAGPSKLDPAHLPLPMRNSAILSCLHEKWAAGEAEADALLASGAVTMAPSHTKSVAAPLVAMVSPSTTVAEIADGPRKYFAFLGTGGGPQLRFGSLDPAILEKMKFREAVLAQGFAELLDAPVDLLAIARAAIREGDDLHNRLSSATTLLFSLLSTRKTETESAKKALQTLAEAPLYFLNVWMPACQLMLLAAEGEPGSSIVTRLCANGEQVGLQVAGLPGEWFTAPATPVQGPFMKGAPDNPRHPPATGDSGVIDGFGLGGQGLRHAPSLRAAFEPWLEKDDDARARSILSGFHPILETPFGLDAATVARPPLLSTGMVSADGRGLLGRGLCAVPARDRVVPALHVRERREVDAVPLVPRHPGKGGDVGDGVFVGKIGRLAQALVQHAIQALGFIAVALAAVGNLVLLGAHEVVRLAEHRPDAAHLEHEPLQRDPLAAVGRGQEAVAGLRGQVDEDRARLEQRQPSAGTVRIHDRGDAVVRIDGEELGLELLVLADVHGMHRVGQAALLQHHGDLAAVGRAPGVELDHSLPFR